MFESLPDPVTCAEVDDAAVVAAIGAYARADGALTHGRLMWTAELLRRREPDPEHESQLWTADWWSSLTEEVGAEMGISTRRANTQLRQAEDLSTRFPQVAALLAQGVFSGRLVSTILWRTRLVAQEVAAAVDAAVAEQVAGWGVCSDRELEVALDAIVEELDPDARLRYQEAVQGLDVRLGKPDDARGAASLFGAVTIADAEVIDQTLTAMSATVCRHDPRSTGELRSAAMGARFEGRDRLDCRCERPECDAWSRPAVVASTVMVHLLADEVAVTAALERLAEIRARLADRGEMPLPAEPDECYDPHEAEPEDTGDAACRQPTADSGAAAEGAEVTAPEAESCSAPDQSEDFGAAYRPPAAEADDPVAAAATETSAADQHDEDGSQAAGSAVASGGDAGADTEPGRASAAVAAEDQIREPATSEADSFSESGESEDLRAAYRRPASGADDAGSAVAAEDDNSDAEATAAADTDPDPPPRRGSRPAISMRLHIIPTALLAELLRRGATLAAPPTPGAEPENGRFPSDTLRRWIQCRDLTCRWPHCTKPAIAADLDHTTPWPAGVTHPSGVKAFCRHHHLIKTFWIGPNGWSDSQSPDGTVDFVSPTGRGYSTRPTTSLIYPGWDTTTAPLPSPRAHTKPAGDRGISMPKRARTRAQDRAARIQAERDTNATREHPPPSPWKG